MESEMMGRFGTIPVLLAAILAGSPAFAQDDPAGDPAGGADAPAADGEDAPAPAPTRTSSSTLSEEELAARRLRGQQNKDLLSVEQDVSNLKERVFRSKATLQLLRELVIEGATIGSRVSVWHVNRLSGAYTLESVQYFLDGKAIFSRTDTTGGLDKIDAIEIHAQTLPPGSHSLQVNMVLRGAGHGVFSYVRAYSFKVQSSYTFTVQDGQITTVSVRLDEKGGPFTSFVDRPDVGYEESMENLRGD
jgi:hypothetical protein